MRFVDYFPESWQRAATFSEDRLVQSAVGIYGLSLDLMKGRGPSSQAGEMKYDYKPGDPVIFRVTKQSTDPGPRAVDVHPAQSGETYSYQVDKFWTVSEVLSGTVQLVTRRGKQRTVSKNDIRLRPARWWEKWLYGARFPKLSQLTNMTSTASVD